MRIPIKEFDFTFARSSGAGGQNVNKLNTKVTLIWDLDHSKSINEAQKKRFKLKYGRVINSDGVVKIISQRYRNQSRNIADCTEKLHEMLESVAKPPKRRIDTKPTKGSIKRRITTKKNKGEVKKNRKKVDY